MSWVMITSPSIPMTSVMWVMRREPSRRRAAWMMTSMEPTIISLIVFDGNAKPPMVIIDSRREMASRGLLELELGSVLAGDDAFVEIDITGEAIEERRLAGTRAARNQDIAAHPADD